MNDLFLASCSPCILLSHNYDGCPRAAMFGLSAMTEKDNLGSKFMRTGKYPVEILDYLDPIFNIYTSRKPMKIPLWFTAGAFVCSRSLFIHCPQMEPAMPLFVITGK